MAALGERLCHSAEEFKAWSQNLGHEGVLTTLYSYGEVQTHRQVELIQQLGKPGEATGLAFSPEDIAKAVAIEMKK